MRFRMPWGHGEQRGSGRSEISPFFTLHREIDRLFDDTLRGFGGSTGSTRNWPALDISESDDHVQVRVELPGLTEENVEVTMSDGVLVIRGNYEEEQKDLLYSERYAGQFERHIRIPAHVEDDGVAAEFHNGLLSITLKKSAESKIKRIPINSGSQKLLSH